MQLKSQKSFGVSVLPWKNWQEKVVHKTLEKGYAMADWSVTFLHPL